MPRLSPSELGQASARAQRERLGETGYSAHMSSKGKLGGRPDFYAATRTAWEQHHQAERKASRPRRAKER